MNTFADTPFPEMADIETSSDRYAARFSGSTGTWMLKRQERLVLKQLRKAKAQTVLDVGGGHGQLAIPLARAGYQVTVVGSSEVCSQRIQDEIDSEQLDFIVANVLDIPFIDHMFDAVVSVRLLPHCEQWPKLIRELCRLAQKMVIVDYPNTQSLNRFAPLFFGAKKKMEGNTRTWIDFKHEQIEQAFNDNHFTTRSHTGQFFLPMALHRMLNRRFISSLIEAPFKLTGLTHFLGSPTILSASPRHK